MVSMRGLGVGCPLPHRAAGGSVPEEVACHTIRDVSAIDFAYAEDLHCTIRQISHTVR